MESTYLDSETPLVTTTMFEHLLPRLGWSTRRAISSSPRGMRRRIHPWLGTSFEFNPCPIFTKKEYYSLEDVTSNSEPEVPVQRNARGLGVMNLVKRISHDKTVVTFSFLCPSFRFRLISIVARSTSITPRGIIKFPSASPNWFMMRTNIPVSGRVANASWVLRYDEGCAISCEDDGRKGRKR
ncbi:hypothetical protein BDN72DRAFT_526126 [Pluteus cervinus]|uniref:Uncharacterized protein n=1 Tax=Pluteus cervinus TaxID=181527 RepID=A0ACD3A4F0_9AGAR|nr:hypothetical protein BDN72DRAFT_526126 [Pluteus cervinus]